ncbi:MAG TPA: hypothetical protein G4N92_08590 [Anaerolineae bacterium]|nr:hypothetical protein [Anaerolineae bacterium]
MANSNNNDPRASKRLRWIARVLGSLVAVFWLFAGIGSGMNNPNPLMWEDAIMAGLIATSVIGVLVAWKRELTGGIIILVCAIAHITFASIIAGHNKGFAMLISGGPLLLVGTLFLASWWRSRPKEA